MSAHALPRIRHRRPAGHIGDPHIASRRFEDIPHARHHHQRFAGHLPRFVRRPSRKAVTRRLVSRQKLHHRAMQRHRHARHRERMRDLLPAPQWIAVEHGRRLLGQRPLCEPHNPFPRRLAAEEMEDRQSERRLDDQPVTPHRLGLAPANRRARLQVARVEQPVALPLDQQLGRADNVGRRIRGERRVAPRNRNAELECPECLPTGLRPT